MEQGVMNEGVSILSIRQNDRDGRQSERPSREQREREGERKKSSHNPATNNPLSITQLCPSMLTYCELSTSDKINPSQLPADRHRKGQRR